MDEATIDRVEGVLLGTACGDALGVPYEFGSPLAPDFEPRMTGGGPFGFAPGEYSDDTAMSVCVAEVAATGIDLTTEEALDQIAERFLEWAVAAKDVGEQTSTVFQRTRAQAGSRGQAMREVSQSLAFQNPGHVGNGALMRTAIVGLTSLDDREHTAASARAVAGLTHADPLGLSSCVLWSEAVRVAVTEGRFDLAGGLDLLPDNQHGQWNEWIRKATATNPRRYDRNGFTVWALQAAWAAITWTPVPRGNHPGHLAEALKNAVRIGDDTDTVGAIAGSLLGARWGRSAIPEEWLDAIHGYGGHRADGLAKLTRLVALR